MKKNKVLFRFLIFLIFLFFYSVSSFGQSIGISPQANSTPNPNAGLDINYTNKGLLIPRVALISSENAAPLMAHIAGMLVYNTASSRDLVPGLYYNNGQKWLLVFQKTANQGGMLYWDGSAWRPIVQGQTGQRLKINSSGLPVWAP
jgi:hypothetical protein